jgi:RNA polymerase sigma-70 factor (ECF subfamily)
MAYYSGLSQREIAERLERPLGTVKSQIRSAMRRLADRLVAADAPPIERT